MQELKNGSSLQGGKYRIVRMLGQGGFGITYEGVQSALGRKVAIKEFFMKDYCNRDASTAHVTVGTEGSRNMVSSFKAKFLKEAQTIAILEDVPHVVRIYDIFEENQTAYYVMEYLGGGSLDGLMKHGPMTEAQAVDYIRQVGEALAELHRRKMLHLDIKPANVLLNGKGEAVVIDFGVSKHYDQSGSQTSSTPVGLSKGYAPLEQYQSGGVEQFTPATDVYSLGATLYALVSGQQPPEASIVMERGVPRVAGLSAQTQDAIAKAMTPLRTKRPQTVAEFLTLLTAKGSGRAATAKTEAVPVGTSIVAAGASAETVAASSSSETVAATPQKPVMSDRASNIYDDKVLLGAWLMMFLVLMLVRSKAFALYWEYYRYEYNYHDDYSGEWIPTVEEFLYVKYEAWFALPFCFLVLLLFGYWLKRSGRIVPGRRVSTELLSVIVPVVVVTVIVSALFPRFGFVDSLGYDSVRFILYSMAALTAILLVVVAWRESVRLWHPETSYSVRLRLFLFVVLLAGTLVLYAIYYYDGRIGNFGHYASYTFNYKIEFLGTLALVILAYAVYGWVVNLKNERQMSGRKWSFGRFVSVADALLLVSAMLLLVTVVMSDVLYMLT